MQDFIKDFINDVAVELTEQFDTNFTDKAFFGDKWADAKLHNSRGSLMARNNNLRNSIVNNWQIQGTDITWSSSLPYASIHNEGGEITVTEKMKRFFWAMYYKASGAVTKTKSQRNERLTIEAEQWKALALMKVGQKIKIEKRQFIGDHPQVQQAVQNVWNDNFKDFENYMNQIMKK